jgi:LPS sulfotransferase NodH
MDPLRSIVDWITSLETKRWRSTDTSSAQSDPPFNFDAIYSLIQLCEWEDADWHRFFQHHAITPLVVTYEQFAASPEATARQIIRHLGLEPPERLRSEI